MSAASILTLVALPALAMARVCKASVEVIDATSYVHTTSPLRLLPLPHSALFRLCHSAKGAGKAYRSVDGFIVVAECT